MNKDLKRFKKYIDDWYFAGLMNCYSLDPFDLGLASGIVKNKNILIDGNFSVKFHDFDDKLAFTDMKDIFLPVRFLYYKLVTETFGGNMDIDTANPNIAKNVVVSLYDFFMLHESYHLRDTKTKLASLYVSQGYIFNLIEDYYIDSLGMIDHPTLYRLIGDLVSSSNEVEVLKETFLSLEKNPTYEGFLDLIMSIRMCVFKESNDALQWFVDNYEASSRPKVDELVGYRGFCEAIVGFFGKTHEEFYAGDFGEHALRENVMHIIYQFLVDNFPSDIDDHRNRGLTSSANMFDEMVNELFGLCDLDKESEIGGLLGESASFVSVLNDTVIKESVSEANKLISKKLPEFHVRVVDVVDHLKTRTSIDMDKNFLKFASYMTYYSSDAFKTSPPIDKGRYLEEKYLHNYAIDGNVFVEERDLANGYNRPETIILVDGSGSMHSLYQTVLSSAYGAFYSLMSSGYPVQVWVHTGVHEYAREEEVLLMLIASHNMRGLSGNINNSMNYGERFSLATTLSKGQNYDGYAIEAVSKFFSQNDSKKQLCVLSDGSPYGNDGYHDEVADTHTILNIKKLRDMGVSVVSLSLKKSVVENNNFIYGKDNNLLAYGDNLNSSLMKISKMVL